MTRSSDSRARDELLVVEIQVAELFVVAGGWIVEDRELQGLDALSPREHLERAPQESEIRDDLDEDVGQGADPSAHENNEEPVGIRAPPHEVDDCQGLQNHPVP